jgi:membrane-associated protein
VLTALLGLAAGWPAPVVLGLVAALLLAESGTVAGVFLPGTTLLLGLGLWSDAAGVPSVPVIAVSATATVAGAHIGWWQGRRRRGTTTDGSAAPTSRRRRLVDAAGHLLEDRGSAARTAVLAMGHWASAARSVLPWIAGRSGVPYRVAGPALAVSGTAWATTLVIVGDRLRSQVLSPAGVAPVLVLLAVLGGLAWFSRSPSRRWSRPRLRA